MGSQATHSERANAGYRVTDSPAAEKLILGEVPKRVPQLAWETEAHSKKSYTKEWHNGGKLILLLKTIHWETSLGSYRRAPLLAGVHQHGPADFLKE